MKKIILISLLILLCCPAASLAHPGRTDANGGHHDYNNVSGLGSYHYHHGYSAHLHTDGICPYDYNDVTGSNSGSSSSNDSYISSSDNSYWNGYDYGYDYGYEKGFSDAEEKYHSLLAAGIVTPSAIGIAAIAKMKINASRENRHISQLMSQKKAYENQIKSLSDEAKKLEKLNSEKYQTFVKQIQTSPIRSHGYTVNGDTTFDYLIPEGIIINEKGYPEEEFPDPVFGDKFNVFVNLSSNVYHKRTCYHATNGCRIHIMSAQKKYRPCSVCKPIISDLEWYHEYLSLHDMKQRYEETTWTEPDYYD